MKIISESPHSWQKKIIIHSNTCIILYITHLGPLSLMYRQVSNISHTSVGNEIVDHSDVVGAPPVGAAPTTSSFST